MMLSNKQTVSVDTLRPYDILCGRCKNSFHNIGNRRFRVTMNLNVAAYLNCKSKAERTNLVASIVRFLISDVGARFLKPQKNGDGFLLMNSAQAREKVGHALRDMAVAKKRTTIREWTKQEDQQQQQQVSAAPQVQQNQLDYYMMTPSTQKQSAYATQRTTSNFVPPTLTNTEVQIDSIFQLQQSKLKSLISDDVKYPVESEPAETDLAPVLSMLQTRMAVVGEDWRFTGAELLQENPMNSYFGCN